jgi:hypothetical protein
LLLQLSEGMSLTVPAEGSVSITRKE